MYCSGCGQALVAGQVFCPRCGRASGMVPPAPYPMQGQGQMPGMGPGIVSPIAVAERRINALAVAWLVYAGLIVIFGLGALTFANAWIAGHMGDFGRMGHSFGGNGWNSDGLIFPFVFVKFAVFALVIRVALAVVVGIGLLRKAPWGRRTAIIIGCLALIHLPFGTAIGIWSLIVLLGAPNAFAYEALASQ